MGDNLSAAIDLILIDARQTTLSLIEVVKDKAVVTTAAAVDTVPCGEDQVISDEGTRALPRCRLVSEALIRAEIIIAPQGVSWDPDIGGI